MLKVRQYLKNFLLILIHCYRTLISPFLGKHCRFYPSCSCYAQEALEQHGLAKGGYLAVRRVLKCHPFHPGGFDPVPDNFKPTE